jgi:hypothetical protein
MFESYSFGQLLNKNWVRVECTLKFSSRNPKLLKLGCWIVGNLQQRKGRERRAIQKWLQQYPKRQEEGTKEEKG